MSIQEFWLIVILNHTLVFLPSDWLLIWVKWDTCKFVWRLETALVWWVSQALARLEQDWPAGCCCWWQTGDKPPFCRPTTASVNLTSMWQHDNKLTNTKDAKAKKVWIKSHINQSISVTCYIAWGIGKKLAKSIKKTRNTDGLRLVSQEYLVEGEPIASRNYVEKRHWSLLAFIMQALIDLSRVTWAVTI